MLRHRFTLPLVLLVFAAAFTMPLILNGENEAPAAVTSAVQTAENAEFDILSVSWGYVNKMKLAYKGALDIADTPEELLEYFK